MTALSIAEAERRAAADPQVSAVRRPRIRAAGGLASVSELAAAARQRGAAGPENFRRAGVSRPAGVSRRAAAPGSARVPAGVSRDGRLDQASMRRVVHPAPVGVSRLPVIPACERARGEGPVRLTSRGRAVVVSLAVAAAAAVCTLLAAGGAAAASHGSPGAGYQGLHQVVVKPGQTLWSIASAAEPAADPQAVIQQIEAANSLPTGTIRAGQVLWVPRG
jgi:nucleoid-associated protein YgaU